MVDQDRRRMRNACFWGKGQSFPIERCDESRPRQSASRVRAPPPLMLTDSGKNRNQEHPDRHSDSRSDRRNRISGSFCCSAFADEFDQSLIVCQHIIRGEICRIQCTHLHEEWTHELGHVLNQHEEPSDPISYPKNIVESPEYTR